MLISVLTHDAHKIENPKESNVFYICKKYTILFADPILAKIVMVGRLDDNYN